MIGRSGERGSGISVLAARHNDDDDEDDIYIYIITVLVVTKSLCGFVMNQVQYNMESAQYLG